MIKILLVEDHTMVRQALKSRIESEFDLSVIAEAKDGAEAIRMAELYHPEVVVMDIALPNLNGVEAARRISAALPSTRILALSMYSQTHLVQEILKAGAAGFAAKTDSAEDLISAIRLVAAGKTYLSTSVVLDFRAEASSRGLDRQAFTLLSSREREVLQLLAEGKSLKDISEKLHISLSTAETHRRSLKRKLNIDNMADLVKFAIREGLTSLES